MSALARTARAANHRRIGPSPRLDYRRRCRPRLCCGRLFLAWGRTHMRARFWRDSYASAKNIRCDQTSCPSNRREMTHGPTSSTGIGIVSANSPRPLPGLANLPESNHSGLPIGDPTSVETGNTESGGAEKINPNITGNSEGIGQTNSSRSMIRLTIDLMPFASMTTSFARTASISVGISVSSDATVDVRVQHVCGNSEPVSAA